MKVLFDWSKCEQIYDLEVKDLDPQHLFFEPSIKLPLKTPPHVRVSVKVRHVWYEHSFDNVEWAMNLEGEAHGLKLLGPEDTLQEFKKSLEIGLCV